MREYVDELTRQDRVVVVLPHRSPPVTPPPRREHRAGLGALALVALLSLPLLGSATLGPVRTLDVGWRESPASQALPCHEIRDHETRRAPAPTLYVEPTPRTLRSVRGLDEATAS